MSLFMSSREKVPCIDILVRLDLESKTSNGKTRAKRKTGVLPCKGVEMLLLLTAYFHEGKFSRSSPDNTAPAQPWTTNCESAVTPTVCLRETHTVYVRVCLLNAQDGVCVFFRLCICAFKEEFFPHLHSRLEWGVQWKTLWGITRTLTDKGSPSLSVVSGGSVCGFMSCMLKMQGGVEGFSYS